MIPGEYLANSAGWQLTMQSDCRAVLYDRSGTPMWASDINNYPGVGCFLKMEDDCNLVLYSGTSALWQSHTIDVSDGGCRLLLNSRSSLVILGALGTVKGLLFSSRK